MLDSSIEGQNRAEIDLDAQKAYLKSQGIDISTMKDQEIKESNTGSQVFVKGQVVILDAIEDIKFQIYI